jgi:hypothetical protein
MQKNIKAAIKTKIKPLIVHLYLYVIKQPKFMRVTLFVLARFPYIKARLKSIIDEYISSANDFLVINDPVNLSRRARIIYDDLQAKIEGWQKDRN